MPGTGSPQHHKARGTHVVIAVVGLCLALVLSACGSGGNSGPQFVTDMRPTSTATTTIPLPTPTATSVAVVEPTEESTVVISTRSAPRFAYLIIDGVLTCYDSANRTFTALPIPADVILIDHAASPTGDRVGILAVQDSHLVVQFYGADGVALTGFIRLSVPAIPTVESTVPATPGATPVVTVKIPDRTNQMHADWVPQGNAVLVSGPGVNQRVSMSGSVMPISRTGVSGTVIKSIWSPMDSQVAIQTQLQSGDQAIYMLDTGHDEARPLNQFEDVHGKGLSNLQWMPNGLGLVAVVGKVDSGVVMSGELTLYRFDADEPTIIATSWQGGPNATITHAVVSPDGHSVVYGVMVRDLGQWHLHSLWVKSLKGGPAVSITTESGAPLTSLQWTEEGIIWQQTDGTLNVVDSTLVPRPLGTAPQATPVVEPQPQATPEEDLGPVG